MQAPKVCDTCGAKWLDGQLYWSTGKPGLERDLAGLVCNETDSPKCINPQKGTKGGQTWADRLKFLEDFENDFQNRMSH
jgi:hypothetical protein